MASVVGVRKVLRKKYVMMCEYCFGRSAMSHVKLFIFNIKYEEAAYNMDITDVILTTHQKHIQV